MLRYALYARKSKEDKSGLIKSIQDQVDVWRTLAAERGLTIAREYEENKTAKIPGVRPVYKQMIADIKAGRIDGVLVWHINRLARNMEEGGSLAQMLIEGKIKEIRTPHWTYKPGDNILPLLLEQGMSTQYSLDLSEAVIRGTNSMVGAGGWPHRAKVGYLNTRDPLNPKKGIVIKDPERFAMLRSAFDLLLTGAYSVRQVVDIMNKEWGFQTRTTPNQAGRRLSYSGGNGIFTSPFYAGFTLHNGVQRRGAHPPMLSVQEYNRVQEIIQRRAHARRRKHTFAYTGLITCGYCGLQVTAEYHRKCGKDHVYYRCSDPYGHCTKKGINEANLERRIVQALEQITIDPVLAELAIENIARWQGEQSQDVEDILSQQHRTLEEIEQQRDNLLNMMLRGLMADEALYKAKEAQFLKERNDLQRQIQATIEELEHIRAQSRAGARFMQQACEQFLVGDVTKKKEIARSLGLRYVLRGNDLEMEIEPMLVELVKYVDEIMVSIEPRVQGSKSQYRADFSRHVLVGRGTQTLLEPPESLIKTLQDSHFYDLFATQGFPQISQA